MEVSAPDFLITSSNDRGRSWGETETRDLIKIWADDTIQAMLNGLTFNHKVFVQISEVMKCRGYDRNPKQCREKIKKLRLDYKKIVGEKKNGSEKGETTWKFFEAMHEVLGRPAPTCGRNSAAREEEEDDDEDDEEDYYDDDDDDETTTSEDEEEDEDDDDDDDEDDDETTSADEGEDETPCIRQDAPRKRLVLFSTKQDIILLGEVVNLNPFASKEQGRMWDFVGEMVTDALQGDFEVDGKTCRERTMLLLDYYKKQDFPSLRRFGTERLYAKKEDLLRQVMELEAEKSPPVNGDGPKHQPEERRDQISEELAWSEPEKPDITTLPPAGGMDVNTSSLLVAAEAEDERAPAAELPAAPAAKRPCHCCFKTYAGILSFLEKRSEAEQRLREEELSFRRQELDIQKSKIALERERLEVEKKERERRFELESQERKVILNLLKEKVLTG